MKPKNSGFSMLEALVASVIMVMIVMMLGMIFHQTSQAWRTGRHRANTYQQIRALFGAIQRDACAAVDEKTLPEETLKMGGQNFKGSSLSFYTLTGSSERDKPVRSLTFITYSGASRTIKHLDSADGQGGPIIEQNKDDVSLKGLTFTPYPDDAVFPDYVTVQIELEKGSRMENYDIGAASSGPNMIMGRGPEENKRGGPGYDDIKTWVD